VNRANAETLAFVLPGLVHEFGNVLQTLQGHVLAVATNLGDAQRVVLQATARGGSSLEILRCLLGDPSSPAADPAMLLGQIGELVRVPMRQAQQLLELPGLSTGNSSGHTFVDSAAFAILLVETLHQLVAAVPRGVRGTIRLELEGAPAGATVVQVRFTATAGDLPFPLPLAELQHALRLRAQQVRAAASCHIRGQAIAWEWHAEALSRHHEA
jgi:hypothetical protein